MQGYKYIPPLIHGTLKRTYASQLAMICGESGDIWHIENHIIVRSSLERLATGELHLDFFSPDIEGGLPFMQTVTYNLSYLSAEKALSEMCNMIQDGFITLKVDEYEVEGLTRYRHSHFNHRLMLCSRIPNGFLATTYFNSFFSPVFVKDSDLLRTFSEECLSEIRLHTPRNCRSMPDRSKIRHALIAYLSASDALLSFDILFSDCSPTEKKHYRTLSSKEHFLYGSAVYPKLISMVECGNIHGLAPAFRLIYDRSKLLLKLVKESRLFSSSSLVHLAGAFTDLVECSHHRILYYLNKSDSSQVIISATHYISKIAEEEEALMLQILNHLQA